MSLQFGMQPFWFWNGEMKEEEVRSQIDKMAEQGIKGFIIHPRQGMDLPYLTDSYFEMVAAAVKQASKHGMEVWLYDEYPYPSGVSAGQVVLDHPEYACKSLEKTTAVARAGEDLSLLAPWGRVVLARAYRLKEGRCDWEDYVDLDEFVGTGYSQDIFQLSGLTEYNKKRFFTGDAKKLLRWKPKEGEWKVYLYTEAVLHNFKYFDIFVDPLNEDAVAYFIQTTHEKYKKYIGEEFGRTIKGIFTDEITAFPPQNPWSPLLPSYVMELNGIDLIQYLPALTEDMGEITSRVRYAYWNAATEGFIRSYEKQIYAWCEKNGLYYIGEKPIMRTGQLKYNHIPGIDAGHQKVGSKALVVDGSKYRANGKAASSAMHFYRKEGALCEAFHSIGWGMTLQDMKWTFDWLAVTGINWFVLHAFFYTADGLKKHDAPPSSFYQMPWWKHMHQLSRYVDRLGRIMVENKRKVKILAVDPVTSVWTETDEQKKEKLKEDFGKLQNLMLENQLDYYIADADIIEDGAVKTKEEGTKFVILGEEYDIILLPPMTNMEDSTFKKIREYLEKGGNAGFFGCLPKEQIQEERPKEWLENWMNLSVSDMDEKYFKGAGDILIRRNNWIYTSSYDEMIEWMKEGRKTDWYIEAEDGKGMSGLIGMEYYNEKEKYYFMVNSTDKKRRLRITLKDDGEGFTYFWDLMGNKKRPVKKPKEGFFLELDAFESVVLLSLKEQKECGNEIEISEEVSLDGEWKLKREQLNLLRLGRYKLKLEDGQKAEADCYPIIDQMEQYGFKYPVIEKPYFGCPKELMFLKQKFTLSSRFYVEEKLIDKKSPVYLLMEPETLKGQWKIKLNGYKIAERDFKKKFIYHDTNLAVEISEYLRPGKNKLKIFIDTDVSYGGLRNPLYLAGDFSVRKAGDDWCLNENRKQAGIKDRLAAGIPFYVGETVYEKKFEIEEEKIRNTDRILLVIGDRWLEDTVEIVVNGTSLGSCICRPYHFELPVSLLKSGQNTLRLKLWNTAIGLYEGQYFDYKLHKYVDYEKELKTVESLPIAVK